MIFWAAGANLAGWPTVTQTLKYATFLLKFPMLIQQVAGAADISLPAAAEGSPTFTRGPAAFSTILSIDSGPFYRLEMGYADLRADLRKQLPASDWERRGLPHHPAHAVARDDGA